MVLLRKLWYRLFPIKKYLRDNHYNIYDDPITAPYIITITILKGEFAGAIVGFETLPSDEDVPHLILKSRLIYSRDGYDFTNTHRWYKIAVQIFEDEYKNALDNYNRLKREVLNDETDEFGTDYFEESITQRNIYKKGSAISKKRVFSRQKRKTSISGDAGLHSKVQPPTDHGSDTDIFGGKGRDI